VTESISVDLAEALYALRCVFQDNPIPQRVDRKPLIPQDTLIERLGVLGIVPLKARALIDFLIAEKVFEVDDSQVNIQNVISLSGNNQRTYITPLRRLAIDRATWEDFLQGRAERAEESGQRRCKPRGRKRRFDSQRDQETAQAWQRARDAGTTKKEFARDKSLSLKGLDRILNRHAARARRARKNQPVKRSN
jgi:hypothetical protein